MELSKNVVWLASYPKSGNTWFRALLTYLAVEDKAMFALDSLDGGPIASDRSIIDDYLLIESSDYSAEIVEEFRIAAFLEYSKECSDAANFVKIHDMLHCVSSGRIICPAEITKCAIYIVRNPLDIAVSYAHHCGESIAEAVPQIVDPQRAIGGGCQVRQKLGSWSDHVRSWTEQTHFPICVIRYEDMLMKPLETFSRALRFAGLEYPEAALREAIVATSFERLSALEKVSCFREASPNGRFFRKGKSGEWRARLTESQVKAIFKAHGDTMASLGYFEKRTTQVSDSCEREMEEAKL